MSSYRSVVGELDVCSLALTAHVTPFDLRPCFTVYLLGIGVLVFCVVFFGSTVAKKMG